MRVAIYARVSTQRQAQTQSIEQQIERLKAYVSSQGWLLEPDHLYRDDGYSGAKLNRPGLDLLRDHAKMAEFERVLITAPDRLARNYVHQVLVIEELERNNITVEFLDRPMNDNPHDQLLLQIRGAVAEYERTLISDRMRRGRQARYRAGKLLPWTRIVFGYRTDPDCPRDPALLKIDPTEAGMIRQMFAWYLEPKTTLYSIGKRLMDLRLSTPTGKTGWNTSTIRGILKNPAYTGTVYANRFQATPPRKRRSALQPVGSSKSCTLRPTSDWIPIPIPAIVSQELFDQVQEKLALNQKMASRNNKTYQYLLRGLVSCGACRMSAPGRSSRGGYHYYVCKGHTDTLRLPEERCSTRLIPAGQLDAIVWQDLCTVLTHPEMIAHALDRAHGGYWMPQELRSHQEVLEKARKQLERQQERLLEAYLADVIKLPELERKRSELSRKQESLGIQIAQLEVQASQQIEMQQITETMEAFCAKIQPILDHADFSQKRQLVELLIDRVIVNEEEVEIRYVIPTQEGGPQVPFCHLRSDYRTPFRRGEEAQPQDGRCLS